MIELCHVESIDGFVHRMQRSYLAHIHKNDDSILKCLLFSSERSRRPGRYISIMHSVLQRKDCTMTKFVKKAVNNEYSNSTNSWPARFQRHYVHVKVSCVINIELNWTNWVTWKNHLQTCFYAKNVLKYAICAHFEHDF